MSDETNSKTDRSMLPTGPMILGSWPANCVQRAFVDGARWWEFTKTGGTMWSSDRNLAEDEAVKRYGDPAGGDVFQKELVRYRHRLREALYRRGVLSNPGVTDDWILDQIDRLLKP